MYWDSEINRDVCTCMCVCVCVCKPLEEWICMHVCVCVFKPWTSSIVKVVHNNTFKMALIFGGGGVYTGWPKNNGTVNFSGLCSDQQLSFFTLLTSA